MEDRANLPPGQMRRSGRLVHVDLARGIMLLLGIPFHVSEAYRIDYQWYVVSGQPSLLLTFVSGTIHSFRMPALFLLSGYFAALVAARKGVGTWAAERVSRLLVPLVATTLCLGLLETGLAQYFRSADSLATIAAWTWAQGPGAWIMHRWFLVVLLIYSRAYAAWLSFCGHRLPVACSSPPFLRGGSVMLLLACSGLLSAVAGKLAGMATGEIVRFYIVAIVRYAPMFALGAWLGRCPEEFDRILLARRGSLVAGGAALALYLALFVPLGGLGIPASVDLALKRYGFPVFEPVAGWYVSIMFLASLRAMAQERFAQGVPGSLRLLVDNAMAIYLFHMVYVIGATGLMQAVNWPPVAEFAVATVLATCACLATVLLLQGTAFYERVFNGRRATRGS